MWRSWQTGSGNLERACILSDDTDTITNTCEAAVVQEIRDYLVQTVGYSTLQSCTCAAGTASRGPKMV